MTEGCTCIQVRELTVSHHSIDHEISRGAQLGNNGVCKHAVDHEVLPGTK